MNILIVVDKHQSAIHRLALSIKKHLKHFNIKILPFHPKRPDAIQISELVEAWGWADIVHISYWKSGEKIKELYPAMFENKRKLLWHHNPYDIDKQDWTDTYKRVVVHNLEIQEKIPYAKLIPQGIDLDFYKFNPNYTDEKVVQMVVGRIEGKKGVKEVAQACKDLGYKFLLVGKISKRDYFGDILKVNPDTEFRENITDEELLNSYYESAVHICNSVDGFESGTMPILEAMATGVPVLTRNIGHVPDMYDGGNMVVRMGKQDDIEDLKTELYQLMENKNLRVKMREKAWETVKQRPDEKMAISFGKLYYEIMGEKKPLVSVIVPTFDRPKTLITTLARIDMQEYPNKEIVLVDSGNTSIENMLPMIRDELKTPIKYIRFKNNGEYTLPKARNLGIIEAQGEYIMLVDDRIGLEPNAIQIMVDTMMENIWLFGIKDGVEKGFVENFSMTHRKTLIKYGMFNERIDSYGGASQEIRNRFGSNGVVFERVYGANARGLCKTNKKNKEDIVSAKLKLWKLYGSN